MEEIIVVDASPYWKDTRDTIVAQFESSRIRVPLIYVQANTASLTAQRNQGIRLASSNVVFLFDDDSLMYPRCAEEIMKVYDCDLHSQVMGVSAVPIPSPPDAAIGAEIRAEGAKNDGGGGTWFRNKLKLILGTEKTYFLPYEDVGQDASVPDSIRHLNVHRIQVMTGSCMTFRREIFAKEEFCEILKRYAAGEDQDFSYRASRHGALVVAINAQLCHLEISGGRLTTFQVTVLAALNPAVLQKLYSKDPASCFVKWRRILWRRLLINILRDLEKRDFLLPRTRGVAYALTRVEQIYRRSSEELATWYPGFQQDLINWGIES
jgi:GT2 family glycosyltransferase